MTRRRESPCFAPSPLAAVPGCRAGGLRLGRGSACFGLPLCLPPLALPWLSPGAGGPGVVGEGGRPVEILGRPVPAAPCSPLVVPGCRGTGRGGRGGPARGGEINIEIKFKIKINIEIEIDPPDRAFFLGLPTGTACRDGPPTNRNGLQRRFADRNGLPGLPAD